MQKLKKQLPNLVRASDTKTQLKLIDDGTKSQGSK